MYLPWRSGISSGLGASSATEPPPPPGPPCALLSPSRSRVGLVPTLLLVDRLGGWSRLSDGEQFSTEVVALPLGLFPPAPLFCQFLPQRGLGLFRDLQANTKLRRSGRLLHQPVGEPLDGFRSQLRRGVLRLFGGSAFWSSPLALTGFFQQLDISHGRPRDERSPGVFFFGVFFFDGLYGESTGVVADQSSVEAAPSREPHGYSLSIPLLRQVPGQRASHVRLHSPGILPLPGLVPPVLGHPRACGENSPAGM